MKTVQKWLKVMEIGQKFSKVGKKRSKTDWK
jgi:hypothetical protein